MYGEAAGRVAAGERALHLVDDEGGETPVGVGERRLERFPASTDEPLEGSDAGVRAVERARRTRNGRRRARSGDGGQEHAAPPWHAPCQGRFGVSASPGVGAVRLPSTAVGQLRHLSARSSVFSRENEAAHDVKPESHTTHAKSQHLRHLLVIPVRPWVDPAPMASTTACCSCSTSSIGTPRASSTSGASTPGIHDEELIVLHFLEEGRRVRISGRTSELPRRLAQGIASAWFATSVVFRDDLVPAHPASLRRLVDALLTGTVTDVRLVEVAVRNAPVTGAPLLIVRAAGPRCDVAGSVADLEGKVGPLIERVADIEHLKVEFNRRIIEIDFPLVGDQPLVRFADGRLDRHAAERFRLFVEQAFGLPMHSMEAPCV